jgi:drug/metabolite transporter (DMT)-like permease
VLIVWGQHHIASGLASILNATTPLFTVLVAHLSSRDRHRSHAHSLKSTPEDAGEGVG